MLRFESRRASPSCLVLAVLPGTRTYSLVSLCLLAKNCQMAKSLRLLSFLLCWRNRSAFYPFFFAGEIAAPYPIHIQYPFATNKCFQSIPSNQTPKGSLRLEKTMLLRFKRWNTHPYNMCSLSNTFQLCSLSPHTAMQIIHGNGTISLRVFVFPRFITHPHHRVRLSAVDNPRISFVVSSPFVEGLFVVSPVMV
jgi:hypothetical protein